jgi:exodeoxyribonuclease VII large subunit
LLDRHGERLDARRARLGRASALLVERRRAGLEQSAAKLRALSPLATLERGYAIVRHEGAVVRETAALNTGDDIDVRVSQGRFTGTVKEVHE